MISAVATARNEEAYIAPCLKSLVNQADEVILVDDGSTDRTVQVASSFPVKVLRRDFHDIYLAKREGILAASNPLVVAVDGDTVLASNWVHEAYRLLRPKVSLVTGFIQPLDRWTLTKWLADFQNGNRFYLSGCSYMLRRSDFLKLFGYIKQGKMPGDEVPLHAFYRMGVVVKSPKLIAWTRLPTKAHTDYYRELRGILVDALTLSLQSANAR